MSELSCGTRFIGRNETLDLSLSHYESLISYDADWLKTSGLGSLKYSLAPPNAASTAWMRYASVHVKAGVVLDM